MTPATTTTLTCANGANFDLLNPKPEDVSFLVISEHLSKANRYCGATPGLAYSVAQHSVLCAKAALATGDRELAAYMHRHSHSCRAALAAVTWQREIHKWDRIMLSTEWRDLMRFEQPYDFGQQTASRRGGCTRGLALCRPRDV